MPPGPCRGACRERSERWKPGRMAAATPEDYGGDGAAQAKDPVCGMSVDPATAKHRFEHAGKAYVFCCAGCLNKFAADPERYLEKADAADGAGKVKDPVCGMSVDPATARHRFEHAGRAHVFCSAGCLSKFAADPGRYLAKASDTARAEPHAAAAAPADAIYTCPMHPEIEQVGPGDCPICGMALEPKTVSVEQGPSAEYLDMRRRFIVGAILVLPLVVIAMGRHLAPHGFAGIPARWLDWAELVLATPIVVWAAAPFFKRFWASLTTMHPNMWTLIGLGVGAAYAFSVVATHRARHLPRRLPRACGRGRRLLRGGRGHRRPGAPGPGAGDPGARADRRRDPGAARPGAEDGAARPRRRPRRGGAAGARPASATGCGSGRARRSRWTARSSRGAARSTSRC